MLPSALPAMLVCCLLAATPAAAQTLRVAVYVTVPEGAFEVVDQGRPGPSGTQPFAPGPLFQGALPPTNALLTSGDDVAALFPGQQLDLAILLGPGARRPAALEGVVATFRLTALAAVDDARITLDENPVRETKLVLADRTTERRFQALGGLRVSVTDPVPGTAASRRSWAWVKGAFAPATGLASLQR